MRWIIWNLYLLKNRDFSLLTNNQPGAAFAAPGYF